MLLSSAEIFEIITFVIFLFLLLRIGLLFGVMRKYNSKRAIDGYSRAASNMVIEWISLVVALFFMPLINLSLQVTDQLISNFTLIGIFWVIGLVSSLAILEIGSSVDPDTIESISIRSYDVPGPAGSWLPYLMPGIKWNKACFQGNALRFLNIAVGLLILSLIIYSLLMEASLKGLFKG